MKNTIILKVLCLVVGSLNAQELAPIHALLTVENSMPYFQPHGQYEKTYDFPVWADGELILSFTQSLNPSTGDTSSIKLQQGYLVERTYSRITWRDLSGPSQNTALIRRHPYYGDYKLEYHEDSIYITITNQNEALGYDLANDREVWRTSLDNRLYYPPVILGNNAYIVSKNNIYVLDKATGRLVNSRTISDQLILYRLVRDKYIFCIVENEGIVAINAKTLEREWLYEYDLDWSKLTELVIQGDLLFFAGNTSLQAIHVESGSKAWEIEARGQDKMAQYKHLHVWGDYVMFYSEFDQGLILNAVHIPSGEIAFSGSVADIILEFISDESRELPVLAEELRPMRFLNVPNTNMMVGSQLQHLFLIKVKEP